MWTVTMFLKYPLKFNVGNKILLVQVLMTISMTNFGKHIYYFITDNKCRQQCFFFV